jgi:hypothetical protein
MTLLPATNYTKPQGFIDDLSNPTSDPQALLYSAEFATLVIWLGNAPPERAAKSSQGLWFYPAAVAGTAHHSFSVEFRDTDVSVGPQVGVGNHTHGLC